MDCALYKPSQREAKLHSKREITSTAIHVLPPLNSPIFSMGEAVVVDHESEILNKNNLTHQKAKIYHTRPKDDIYTVLWLVQTLS